MYKRQNGDSDWLPYTVVKWGLPAIVIFFYFSKAEALCGRFQGSPYRYNIIHMQSSFGTGFVELASESAAILAFMLTD